MLLNIPPITGNPCPTQQRITQPKMAVVIRLDGRIILDLLDMCSIKMNMEHSEIVPGYHNVHSEMTH